jgi:FkbM family methyltransferase
MTIRDSITSISYDPRVRKYIQRLGMTGLLQGAYRRLRAASGATGTVRLSLDGIRCLFSVTTPDELRCIEGAVLIHEREMLSGLRAALKPGNVFLDVGSNVGVFTVLAAKVLGPMGTVIACEPGTQAFQELETNIALNELTNVKALKLALSDARSMKMLTTNKSNCGNRLSELCGGDGQSEEVRTVDYDSLVEEDGLPVPQVVKIDVEGHEYSVLRGMRRTLSSPSCAALFCEIHPRMLPAGVSAQDVSDLLQSYGFKVLTLKVRGGEYHATALKKSSDAA